MISIDIKIKRVYARMIHVILNEQYKIAKVISTFCELPEKHQDALVCWLKREIKEPLFDKYTTDSVYYIDFLKGILMRYTGRDGLGEPVWKDLAKIIGKFIMSDECKYADMCAKESVKEELENL